MSVGTISNINFFTDKFGEDLPTPDNTDTQFNNLTACYDIFVESADTNRDKINVLKGQIEGNIKDRDEKTLSSDDLLVKQKDCLTRYNQLRKFVDETLTFQKYQRKMLDTKIQVTEKFDIAIQGLHISHETLQDLSKSNLYVPAKSSTKSTKTPSIQAQIKDLKNALKKTYNRAQKSFETLEEQHKYTCGKLEKLRERISKIDSSYVCATLIQNFCGELIQQEEAKKDAESTADETSTV